MWQALYASHGVSPMRMLALPLVQLPVFLSFFVGLKRRKLVVVVVVVVGVVVGVVVVGVVVVVGAVVVVGGAASDAMRRAM